MAHTTRGPIRINRRSNVLEFVANTPEHVTNFIETLMFLENRVNFNFDWDIETFSDTEGEIVFNNLESADTTFRLMKKMNRHAE